MRGEKHCCFVRREEMEAMGEHIEINHFYIVNDIKYEYIKK